MARWMFYLFCLLGSSLLAADPVNGQLLVYRVTEPGSEPYISRILVTPQYLRLDRGEADDGFILFKRPQATIYSVNSVEQTILEVAPKQAPSALPDGMKLTAEKVAGEATPELAGKQTDYWRFRVNGRLCRSAIVAPGLMSQAAHAYGEYLELLAMQHYATLDAIPREMRDACDEAVNIFEPLAVIAKGLPLREWDEMGGLQELLDYRDDYPVPAEDLLLPEGYQQIRLRDLQAAP
jgi:hypothetical protein